MTLPKTVIIAAVFISVIAVVGLIGIVEEAQTQQQQQLQLSTITGTASPITRQIIDAVKAECGKTIQFQPDPQLDLESFLVDSCLFLVYESATTVVLNGDLLINQSPAIYIDNPFIWQAVDEFKVRGYTVDSVQVTGQGNRGNPHEVYVVMSR